MEFIHSFSIHFIIILQIVFAHPPQKVPFFKLTETGDEYEIDTTFNRIQTFLANENLPVWIVYERDPGVLEPMKYYGTIDHRYVLQEYNPTTNPKPIEGINMFKSQFMIHQDEENRETTGISPEDVEVEQGKNWRYIESRTGEPDIVYVETLIVVNYDIVNEFSNNYAAMVSEILITFNSVDMLYSEIEKPKIKINIAGIIIGQRRDSFPELNEDMCYKSFDGLEDEVLYVTCANRAIKSTLGGYQSTIPLNSYDVVVFLTNFGLFGSIFNSGKEKVLTVVEGYANPLQHDEYFGYTLSSADIRICTVGNFFNYQHFSIIAHELAHLFDVRHDPGNFRSLNAKCIGNLMRTDGYYCKSCLYFADTSIHQMNKFFSSRDGCKFRNEPRSLHNPSEPQKFWDENKQCQCYGFLAAKKPQKVDCEYKRRLKCWNDTGHSVETGFFMDGTSCHKHKSYEKVCWNGQCREIVK